MEERNPPTERKSTKECNNSCTNKVHSLLLVRLWLTKISYLRWVHKFSLAQTDYEQVGKTLPHSISTFKTA